MFISDIEISREERRGRDTMDAKYGKEEVEGVLEEGDLI